jgi:HD-GYP domain-containing protein (c-di-GMP phosphodiesterase class II)
MDYASTIARDMGLNDSQMEALQFGSILHDIGKIYIPESVLQKPGSLDDEEWDVMKMHPVIGADLIKDISYLAPAIPVIRHHHERWDGKGYPDGLVGEAIPLEARIVAVADSLDAMTTERVYQSTCTSQEAYDKILSCSGTLYDPGVIDVFQGVWQEIKLRME